MRVKELRIALSGVDDEMVVLLRVQNNDGDEMMMCSPSNAMSDPGCSDTEVFMIDGTDGNCPHGVDGAECELCKNGSDGGISVSR